MRRLTRSGQTAAECAYLRQWATHPSESVRHALLEPMHGQWIFEQAAKRGSDLRPRMVRRALADAAAEGVCWTPLLDYLAASGTWAAAIESSRSGPTTARGRRLRLPSPWDVLAPLRAWLAGETDPTAFTPLLTFAAGEVWRCVAAEARCLTPPLVERLVARSVELFFQLSMNEHLPSAATATLVRALAAYYVHKDRQHGPKAFDVHYTLRQVLERGGTLSPADRKRVAAYVRAGSRWESDMRARNAADFLLADCRTPVRVLADVADLARREPVVGHLIAKRLYMHPQATRVFRAHLLARDDRPTATSLAHTLAEELTDPAALAALGEAYGEDLWVRRHLAKNPRTPIAVLRRMADGPRDRDTDWALVDRLDVRSDPALSEHLIASEDPFIARVVLVWAPLADVPRVWRRVLQRDPDAAVRAFEELPPERMAWLTADDLTALLTRCGAVARADLIAHLPQWPVLGAAKAPGTMATTAPATAGGEQRAAHVPIA
jgi:hypothetical protein